MGKSKSICLFLLMTSLFWEVSVHAAAGDFDDDGSLSGGIQINGGNTEVNLQSDINIPGPSIDNTADQIQTSTECSSRASDTFDASACWGAPQVSKDSNADSKDEKKNSGNSADGKKDGSPSQDADKNAVEQAAALCRSQYQSARESCESAISNAGGTCDSSSDAELNAAAAAAGKSQNTGSMVQLSCSEAGGISNSAKGALTGFRQRCSSAVGSCTSSCGELSTFLQNNPSCYSAIGLTSSSAQSLAQSKNSSCESYQTKVSEAERAISNYGNTSAGAAACQLATLGGQSTATLSPASTVFCQANPSYPGCGSTVSLNCSDPSQSNNKICVCSKNPSDAMCGGTSVSETASSGAGASNDSASRITTKSANLKDGDLPSLPGLQHGALPSGGEAEGIDGRRGGAGVGNSTVSAGNGSAQNTDPMVNEDDLASGGVGGTRGNGMLALARMPSSSADLRGETKNEALNSLNKETPDLRRFLPGGHADPRGHSGITGSVRIGIDGITGPHSNIWQKIQNRYQIIQGTLEP